jgi:hypothetical protein
MVTSTEQVYLDPEEEKEKNYQESLLRLFMDITYLVYSAPLTPEEIVIVFTGDIARRADYFLSSAKSTKESLNNYRMLIYLNKHMEILKKHQAQGMPIYNISPEKLEAFSKMHAAVQNLIVQYQTELRTIWLDKLLEYAKVSIQPSSDMNEEWFETLADLFSAELLIDSTLSKMIKLFFYDSKNTSFKSQLFANMGTMIINKLNYQTCDTRIIALSLAAYQASLQYMPENVPELQRNHVKRNVDMLYFLPCLLKTLAWILGKPQKSAEPQPEFFQKTFAYESEKRQKDLLSVVKFLAMGFHSSLKKKKSSEERIETIKEILDRLANLLQESNPDLETRILKLSSKIRNPFSRINP